MGHILRTIGICDIITTITSFAVIPDADWLVGVRHAALHYVDLILNV